MEVRSIDANALIEKLDNINPVDYGAMSSYETHNGAREALLDAVMYVNDAPTLSLNTLRDEIYADAVAHGLWEKNPRLGNVYDYPDDCAALIKDEVYELEDAAEEWEETGYDDESPEKNRYEEELADIVIMCFSVAGRLGIDIDAAVRRKMEINKGRAWKHGKETDDGIRL